MTAGEGRGALDAKGLGHPLVVEQTSRASGPMTSIPVCSRERVIFCVGPVEDQWPTSSWRSCCSSNRRTGQGRLPVHHSPGGSVSAGWRSTTPCQSYAPKSARCASARPPHGGSAAGGGARRQALLPAAFRVMIHHAARGFQGQATTSRFHAKEICWSGTSSQHPGEHTAVDRPGALDTERDQFHERRRGRGLRPGRRVLASRVDSWPRPDPRQAAVGLPRFNCRAQRSNRSKTAGGRVPRLSGAANRLT